MPSAVTLRKKFGSFSATTNASATGPPPRKLAVIMSRMKPAMREMPVSPPTVAMDLTRDMAYLTSDMALYRQKHSSTGSCIRFLRK